MYYKAAVEKDIVFWNSMIEVFNKDIERLEQYIDEIRKSNSRVKKCLIDDTIEIIDSIKAKRDIFIAKKVCDELILEGLS